MKSFAFYNDTKLKELEKSQGAKKTFSFKDDTKKC